MAVHEQLIGDMGQITLDRIADASIANAHRNDEAVRKGKSLAALRNKSIGASDAAVIIAAGPSIKVNDPVQAILDIGFDGAIIATESALFYCLRNGVIPDLTLSLDPHSSRIVRWFGDPDLTEQALRNDDYYRRQDMDDTFANELRTNEQVLDLLNNYGASIPIALSTSSSQKVVQRVQQIGMEIFWWNPMLDDPDEPGSRTKELYDLNGLPCMNAGGNVGTAAWMLADAVLGKKQVALTGMDLSYHDGTPYERTQYYHELVALLGEDRLSEAFDDFFNPHTKTRFFSDPAYMWYRKCFLEMIEDADCQTFNCSEAGILFGENINFIPFRDFLLASKSANPDIS